MRMPIVYYYIYIYQVLQYQIISHYTIYIYNYIYICIYLFIHSYIPPSRRPSTSQVTKFPGAQRRITGISAIWRSLWRCLGFGRDDRGFHPLLLGNLGRMFRQIWCWWPEGTREPKCETRNQYLVPYLNWGAAHGNGIAAPNGPNVNLCSSSSYTRSAHLGDFGFR